MTVWLVNLFYNLPAEGYPPQRYWQLAEQFAADGHRVVYVTTEFSHANKAPRRFVGEGLGENRGIAVVLLKTVPYFRNISLRRLYSHFQITRRFRREASGIAVRSGTPDLVIASTPPLMLANAAMNFAHAVGAKFVIDINDAWPETFERILPRWTLGWMRHLARRVYRGADAVTAVAESYLELAREYGATAPQHVAYHSA